MLVHVCPFKWKQPRTKKNGELICHSVTSKYHRFFLFHRGPWFIGHSWKPRFRQILGKAYFLFGPSRPGCISQ